MLACKGIFAKWFNITECVKRTGGKAANLAPQGYCINIIPHPILLHNQKNRKKRAGLPLVAFAIEYQWIDFFLKLPPSTS